MKTKENEIKVGEIYRILGTRKFIKITRVGYLGRYAEGITKSGKMYAVAYDSLVCEGDVQ